MKQYESHKKSSHRKLNKEDSHLLTMSQKMGTIFTDSLSLPDFPTPCSAHDDMFHSLVWGFNRCNTQCLHFAPQVASISRPPELLHGRQIPRQHGQKSGSEKRHNSDLVSETVWKQWIPSNQKRWNVNMKKKYIIAKSMDLGVDNVCKYFLFGS